MTKTIESAADVQDQIVEDLSFFDEWEDRYSYLIDIGAKLPPLSGEFKIEEFRIRGCQSKVWIYPQLESGVIEMTADSDTPTVKGLVALLLKLYAGRTPAEIATIEPEFIDRAGLAENLSGIRVNGMRAAAKQIKKYAQGYLGDQIDDALDRS